MRERVASQPSTLDPLCGSAGRRSGRREASCSFQGGLPASTGAVSHPSSAGESSHAASKVQRPCDLRISRMIAINFNSCSVLLINGYTNIGSISLENLA